jgi:kynurenine formamidase
MLDTNKFHNWTKHIDIQYHFVREQLSTQQIKVQHCSTKDMVADIMTKPLGCDKHFYLLKQLGVFGGESI